MCGALIIQSVGVALSEMMTFPVTGRGERLKNWQRRPKSVKFCLDVCYITPKMTRVKLVGTYISDGLIGF